VRQK